MESRTQVEQQLVEANRLAIYRRNARIFLQGRLLLDFVWLILTLYPAFPAPRSLPVDVLVLFPVADLLQLIAYYAALNRWRDAAPQATAVSAAFTAVGIAATLHLSADFSAPAYLLYFVLVASTALATPWVIAAISSLAYLMVVISEMTGLAPAASGKTAAQLQGQFIFALIVVSGIWIVAALMRQLALLAEQRQSEQSRLTQVSERSIEAEAIWSTVGRTVVATQDLNEVLTNVIQILNEKMRVETGSILLREPDADELYFAKTLHGNVEEFASFRIRVGQGIVGWVAQTGQSALVPDTSNDPRWFSGIDRETGFVSRSIVCVPLIAKGETVGVIELLNKKNGVFTDDDLRLLESIAAPVAIAIQNAQLHQQAQRHLAQLTELFHQVENAKKEWEHTVDAIDEGITLVDENSTILRANRTLADWLHTTPGDLVGQPCYRAIHNLDAPPDQCPHRQVVVDRTLSCSAEFDEPHLKGTFLCTSYPFHDASGQFVGTVNVFKDVTAQKRLQAQLIQSEKLAAVGQLAASLAHEINNPLQGIRGALELVREDLGDNTKPLEYLEMSQGEIERLSKIVQRMLDFNRPAGETPGQVDVRATVENILALTAKRLQHANVVLSAEWDDDLPSVRAVDNQLKQVFLNLVLNAVDAMPNGGDLRIRGRQVDEYGKWLVIALTDSGQGIPAEDLDKVFDPFYTTKPDGAGLGLSICRTLVLSQGGRLTVDSQPGKGSTFSVWLPIG